MQFTYNIANTQRAIGTKLSSKLVRKYGMSGLPPGHITVRLRGSAGQSLGAFAVQGLKVEVFGDANDYVGNGDRKSVVYGKSVSVRVDIGGRRLIKKKTKAGHVRKELVSQISTPNLLDNP